MDRVPQGCVVGGLTHSFTRPLIRRYSASVSATWNPMMAHLFFAAYVEPGWHLSWKSAEKSLTCPHPFRTPHSLPRATWPFAGDLHFLRAGGHLLLPESICEAY